MSRPQRSNLKHAAFCVSFAAALLSFVQPSLAIGISPGRIELDFSPGRNSTYEICVIGGSYESIVVSSRQYGKCGLAEYIIPDKTELTLNAGERTCMKVGIFLPSDYPRPGLHECEIVAAEVSQGGYSGVSAFSAATMQVWIRVPYPERYLEGSLSAPNVNLSGIAQFTVSLESMGLQDVTAGGLIKVTDSSGRAAATVQTGSVFVKSMEKGVLQATWDTSGMPAGRYYAEAVVEYGAEEPLSMGSGFKIGDILVRVVNITYPEDIFPDQIVKLEVLADSYWNDRIEGSYVTLDVKKDGMQAGESRSESFDLEPWESRTVPLYWDTAGLSEGSYVAEISVHYSGKTEKGIAALVIKPRGNPYLFPVLFFAAVAALAAVAFYAYRKRKMAGAGKERGDAGSGKESGRKVHAGKSDGPEKDGMRGKGGDGGNEA